MKRNYDTPFTSGEVCRVTGHTVLQLSRLVRSGRIKPRKRSKGKGHASIYTASDVLAIGLMRALDELGVHPGATAMVIDFVRGADLSFEMSDGKRLMLTYGNLAYRKLMRPGDVAATLPKYAAGNPSFDWHKCKIIDLAGALENVYRMIDRLEDEADDASSDAAACQCREGAAT